MAQTRVEEDGTVKRLVRWPSTKRNGASRRWNKKWVIVKPGEAAAETPKKKTRR